MACSSKRKRIIWLQSIVNHLPQEELKMRKLYISVTTGSVYESMPDDGESYFDLKTDAPKKDVYDVALELEKVDDSVIKELRKRGFNASRAFS